MDNDCVEVRRLRLLLELSRLGSMREVADELGYTTSTVSQQLAALAREAGTPLVEPDGRRVRLTAAGRRLADHAITILAAVEAARRDLDPDAEPEGVVRLAGFASAVTGVVMPIVTDLAAVAPGVRLRINEYEPIEALDLLAGDDVDVALVYDYDLAPAAWPRDVEVRELWTVPWGLGVPTHDVRAFDGYADHAWIVNSRHTADEDVVRTLASMAGFVPRVEHRIDSLDVVEQLIEAGLGVGVLPLERPVRDGVTIVPLAESPVVQRAYAAIRRGRDRWPALRLVIDRLRAG